MDDETLIPLIIALIAISGIALLFMGGGSNDTTAIRTPIQTPVNTLYPTTVPTTIAPTPIPTTIQVTIPFMPDLSKLSDEPTTIPMPIQTTLPTTTPTFVTTKLELKKASRDLPKTMDEWPKIIAALSKHGDNIIKIIIIVIALLYAFVGHVRKRL